MARTEFVSLDIGGGVKIDSRLMKPHNFDASKSCMSMGEAGRRECGG